MSGSFQVGYSTTTQDISEFRWEYEITEQSVEWKQFVNLFPAGTQYVAVKYSSNLYRMYLDDFEFEVYSPYEKPRILSDNTITAQRATLSWTAPEGATGYAYTFRQVDGSGWSAEKKVTGTQSGVEQEEMVIGFVVMLVVGKFEC